MSSFVRLLLTSFFLFSSALSAAEKSKQSSETSGCKRTNGQKSDLEVDFIMATRLFFSPDRVPYYILPDELLCLKNHQTHKIVLFETKQVLGEVEIGLINGSTSLRNLWNDVRAVAPKYPGVLEWLDIVPRHFALFYPDTKENDPIQPMTLGVIKKSDQFFNPFSSIVPKIHHSAKTLGYSEVAKFVATEHPFIVDTRPAAIFKWWHLPGAHNFLIGMNPMAAGTNQDFRRILALQAFVPLAQLPADHTKPVLVMAFSETDWSAYFVVSMLRMSGFNNLYWYRGGQEDWHDIRRYLPDGKAPGNVEIVKWQDLEKMRSEYNIVDVRLPSYFAFGHLPGSLSSAYFTRRVPPTKWDPSEPEIFASDKWDETVLPKDKSKPLVIVGSDEADWPSVIATRKAMSLGYKAVWYKGGAAEWRALNSWFGEQRFPIVKSPSPTSH